MLATEAYTIFPYVGGAGFRRTERTRAGETIMVFCIGSALTPNTPLCIGSALTPNTPLPGLAHSPGQVNTSRYVAT